MKTKKISKRTRADAALICLIAASAGEKLPYYRIACDMGLDGDQWGRAYHLAHAAWQHCRTAGNYGTPEGFAFEAEAEAAQLLLDGWSPED